MSKMLDNQGNTQVAVTTSALPTGAATSAKQDTGNTSLASIDGKITAVNTGNVTVGSSVLPTGAATEATLAGVATDANLNTKLGATNETAPGTDTASSGLNGRLQRIAQRLTSLIGLLPTALGTGGGLKVDGSGTALPVSAASLPLPSGAATSAKQDTAQTSLDSIVTSVQVIDDPVATISAIPLMRVAVFDDAGAQVTSFGGAGGGATANTEYARDTASTSTDKQIQAGVVRKDTAASLVDADGDRSQLIVDASGRLHVNGSGVTQPVSASTLPLPTGAATESTLGTLLTQSDFDTRTGATNETAPGTDTASSGLNGRLQRIAQRLTSMIALLPSALGAGGGLKVDGSGTALPVSLASVPSHAVTNAGTFAVQDSEKITDNAAFTDGTTKVMPAGYIFDEIAGTALTENDTAAARIDSKRAQVSVLEDATTRGQRAAVSAAGALKVDGSAVTQPVSLASVPSHAVTNAGTFAVQAASAGDVASDSVDSGNPVKVGGQARSTEPTAVGDADRVNFIASLLGKLISLPYAIPASTWNYAAAAGGLVNTTGVTAKAAAGAGIRNYVTRAQVINSHQTIGTEVLIRDGASGTVLHRGWAQAAGGGYSVVFDPPLRGSANTLIEIGEVTATATAGVLVNLQGYVAAE